MQYCSTLSSTTNLSSISTLHNNNQKKILQCNIIVQHCLQQSIHLLFHLYTTIKTKYCNAILFNTVFNNQFIFYFIYTQQQQQHNIAMQYFNALTSTTNSTSFSSLHNNKDNSKILQCNIVQHCIRQPIHLLFLHNNNNIINSDNNDLKNN